MDFLDSRLAKWVTVPKHEMTLCFELKSGIRMLMKNEWFTRVTVTNNLIE